MTSADGLAAIRAALGTISLDSLCMASCRTVMLDSVVHLAPALVPLGLPALPAAYRLSIDEVARSFPRKPLLPLQRPGVRYLRTTGWFFLILGIFLIVRGAH